MLNLKEQATLADPSAAVAKAGDITKSFCTTREAATLLGVSVGTVQLWVESGLLRAWKTAGGHRRVLRESVQSLLHRSPEPAPDRPEPIAATTARQLSILVVEDDESLLRLYQARLSRWPMAPVVSVANNAITGLIMMGRSNPDLLITDLDMPGMDGFHMLRVLRATPEVNHTALVVVTGLDASDVARRGGVPADVPVLAKPIDFDQLLAIAQGLQQPGSQRNTTIFQRN